MTVTTRHYNEDGEQITERIISVPGGNEYRLRMDRTAGGVWREVDELTDAAERTYLEWCEEQGVHPNLAGSEE